MRFLPFESEDLQKAIEANKFAYADFSFVKRRGKLHVFYQKNPAPFRFFRKETTHLDAEGKWVKQTSYTVFEGAKQQYVSGWVDVIHSFHIWLENLSA